MTVWAEIVAHFRLVWRLFWDERIRGWQRIVFVVPLLYLLVPMRYDISLDVLPAIGLLDDWLLFWLFTFIFVLLCPRKVVREWRAVLALSDLVPQRRERARNDPQLREMLSEGQWFERYRHPGEVLALSLGLTFVIGAAVLGGMAVGVLFLLLVGLSYLFARTAHALQIRDAVSTRVEQSPRVEACLQRCLQRLPDVPCRVLVSTAVGREACVFGLDQPYTIVLGSCLVDELTDNELTVVLARALGHILFEHPFLSSIAGNLLRKVSGANFVWMLALGSWRRFAQQTADRVALLVCQDLPTVAKTIIRLSVGQGAWEADVAQILRQAYAQEQDGWLKGHLVLVKRLRALAEFDAELFTWDLEAWLIRDDTV